MTEVGFEDFEMKYLDRKYPEYDDMTREELNDKYDSLTQDRLNLRDDTGNKDEIISVKERVDYINHLQENTFGSRAGETTFTISNNEIENNPENEEIFTVQEFIRKIYIKMKILFLIQYIIKKHWN